MSSTLTRRAAAIGLLGSVSAVSGCSGVLSDEYNFRLEVEFTAQNGVLRGSGVQRAFWRDANPLFLGLDTVHQTSFGEAIPIDLGPLGLLCLTLNGWRRDPVTDKPTGNVMPWSPDAVSYRTVPRRRRMSNHVWPIWRLGRSLRLGLDDLPIMVLFRDPKDPMSVEFVRPGEFSRSLGGIAFGKARVSATSRSVTEGRIETYLPWLGRYLKDNVHLDGSQYMSSTDATNVLMARDFKRAKK